MQQADVIVYDHLVGDGILDLARRDAHFVYVGKQSSNHTLPQEAINFTADIEVFVKTYELFA